MLWIQRVSPDPCSRCLLRATLHVELVPSNGLTACVTVCGHPIIKQASLNSSPSREAQFLTLRSVRAILAKLPRPHFSNIVSRWTFTHVRSLTPNCHVCLCLAARRNAADHGRGIARYIRGHRASYGGRQSRDQEYGVHGGMLRYRFFFVVSMHMQIRSLKKLMLAAEE